MARLVAVALVVVALCGLGVEGGPTPVILVPGIAGSQLEVRLNSSYEAPRWYCRKGGTGGWTHVWFNLEDYVTAECVAKELHVNVDVVEGDRLRYSNAVGVEVRPVEGLAGIKCLDPHFCELTAYFEPLIEFLESQGGYVLGETLFGAPYDFRMAGDGLTQLGYEEKLTRLIEEIVQKQQRRVTLVAHSMGGMVVTYFLAGKTKTWCDSHVETVVTVSSPYGGSFLALQGSVSGDPIGLPFYHDAFLGVQANSPSGPWLFPASGLFNPEEPAVVTKGKNYTATAESYAELLSDLGRSEQLKALRGVRSLRGIMFDHEGGPKYPEFSGQMNHICFIGGGRPTPLQFTYDDVDSFSPGMDPPAPKYTKSIWR
ncbi:lecithin:cholesterol acyltransferase [Chloropicon primus]|uniref:Lecithin:cholesterol acyltransferase n=1 Tax=Chloropicon primus TaxID=1764295 RepID=A0A5B8MPB9_9CHLO|nr:lecithin:cholesterol acyltransferase [Chloropicon primus]UPR01389.1 lecithin:cholesterol acyltransferase [Chloropicon primus]|eukprot:QDZ22171.1 lecithin:cholesterol acyltransferase [Chloropicon primus]